MRWVACCLLALWGVAEGSGQSAEFRLTDLQWKHRVLLVFAPSPEDNRLQQQHAAWRRALAGMEERDLVWTPLAPGQAAKVAGRQVSPAAQLALRRQYRVADEDFLVLLIGRDGGVKLRESKPVEALRLFALIDSMPMRQQEMRRRESGPKSTTAP